MKTHKTLQISVKSIPETGKEVNLSLGKEWFDRWRQEDPGLEFAQGNISGAVTLAKQGREILIRGHVEGSLVLSCSRCLEPFAAPVAAEFELLLEPAPASQAQDEQELSARELDLDVYSGETVDLEALVREQIILLVPLKPLCQEDCQGLCPTCGANLNRETCSCRENSNQQAAVSHQPKAKN
jgi:DUF177 domain-containing protein